MADLPRVCALVHDGAKTLDLAQGRELPQRLDLDLADALAREPELAPDLVERARIAAVEAVAQLEHPAMPFGQRLETELQRLVAQRLGDGLGGIDRLVVGQEVREARLALVADRL